jgi:hypothetical protein
MGAMRESAHFGGGARRASLKVAYVQVAYMERAFLRAASELP